MSSPSKRLGALVQGLRVARGLSPEMVAGMAGISRMTLSHLESGKTDTRISTLEAVADVLGASLELSPAPMRIVETDAQPDAMAEWQDFDQDA